MRFAITLHIDVPDGTDTDAFEMRGWFEERLEGAFEDESEEEFAVQVAGCEQIPDDDP